MTKQQRMAIPNSLKTGLLLAGILMAACLSAPAQAQNPAQRILSTFIPDGAYFFTHSSGRDAIGSVQFYNEARFYGRPKRIGGLLRLSGGLEFVSASDHFFPFSGGNRFSLIGPTVRVTTERVLNRVRPYVSAGLFVGHVSSDRTNVDVTDFTPSLSVGVEWPFARYFTLSAGYRLTERIGGVNTDGFMVMLRLFQ